MTPFRLSDVLNAGKKQSVIEVPMEPATEPASEPKRRAPRTPANRDTSLTKPAIEAAMKATSWTPEQIKAECLRQFSKSKFTELSEPEQWTLIATIYPETIGPYGESMAPF